MYRMCGNAQLILPRVGAVPAIQVDFPDQQCGIATAGAASPAQPVLDEIAGIPEVAFAN
jgi:hypothetical protein